MHPPERQHPLAWTAATLLAAAALLLSPIAPQAHLEAQDPAALEVVSEEAISSLPTFGVDPAPAATIDLDELGLTRAAVRRSARLLPDGGVALYDRSSSRLIVAGADGSVRSITDIELGAGPGQPDTPHRLGDDRLALWHASAGELHVVTLDGEVLPTRTLESELAGARLLGLLPDGSAVIAGRTPPAARGGQTRVERARHQVEVAGPDGSVRSWASFEQPNQVLVRGEGLSSVQNQGNLPAIRPHLAGERLVLTATGPLAIDVRGPDGATERTVAFAVLPIDVRPRVQQRFIDGVEARIEEHAPGTANEDDLAAFRERVLSEEVEALVQLHRPAADGSLWLGSFATRDEWVPDRRSWLVIDPSGAPAGWFVPAEDGPMNVVDAHGDLLLLDAGDRDSQRLQVHRIRR